MKIIIVNKFLYPKGGDAICSIKTGELLSAKGHEVVFWGMDHALNPEYPYRDYFVSNVDFGEKVGFLKTINAAVNIIYSLEAKIKFGKLLKSFKPDVVHLNNFAHQISPSILHVLKKERIPVVMTMHDSKLVCAAYTFLSHDKICERCSGGKYYHCFFQRCIKDSRIKSLINTVEMYVHHSILNIYSLIDVFISPSEFLRVKVQTMGFKGNIVHLPNFVNLEEYRPCYDEPGERSIVYFGRLSKEKGLLTLIEAMRGLDVELKLIGEGALRDTMLEMVRSLGLNNVKFLGYKTGRDLNDEIRKAMFTVLPSVCYENNPGTIIESFALGKPAIGARIGGIPELVKENETGFTFEPGNTQDLRSKIVALLSRSGDIVVMGKNARTLVETNFSEEVHYLKLIKIYQKACFESR